MAEVNPVDQLLQETINAQSLPGLNGFFTVITQLGSSTLWLLTFGAYFVMGKKKLIAAVFLTALLFSNVANEDLKDIFRRDRPSGADIDPWFITGMNYSFPSQHAQATFLLATLFAAYFGWRYGLITYPIAALVGFSRIYLGVHYLTDVIAGAVTGIVIGELVILSMYVNGMTRNPGLIGHLVRLAGIRPLTTSVTDKQQSAAVITPFIGFCISAVAMLSGFYYLSLLIMAYAYISTINMPGSYRQINSF